MTPPSIPRGARAAWLWAALLVAIAFAARWALQPVFGGAHPYTLSFLVVILTSYVLGRGPAAAAAVVSGLACFYSFPEPAFAWKADRGLVAGLALFWVNAALAIYLIGGLVRALERLAAEQGRAQAVARGHADLFRELNARMSRHMRLVAGVLALQARGEPDAAVAEGLRRAGERSLQLSRASRAIGGGAEPQDVDFTVFARALMQAACAAAEEPPERIVVEGPGLRLPAEEATSLGVALAETATALLQRSPDGSLRVALEGDAGEARVLVRPAQAADALAVGGGSYLLRAMVEQLGARLALRTDGDGHAVEIAVPRAAAPAVRAATVH